MDEYEEGVFSPTLVPASGSTPLNTSFDLLGYTKVGRVVTVTGQIVVGTVSSPSGVLTLGNLPFALGSGTDAALQNRPSIHLFANGSGVPRDGYFPAFIAFNEGADSGSVIITFDDNYDATTGDWMGSGSDLFINFSYNTAS